MGGLSTLRVNATWSSLKLGGLRFLVFLPNLCKKPGQKTPVRSQMARFGVFQGAPDPAPSRWTLQACDTRLATFGIIYFCINRVSASTRVGSYAA